MPTDVIMPALELAQETGKVLHWLKAPGDTVTRGEPIVEIETDKATVEIEARAAGVLRGGPAGEGDPVPVGRTIALIFAAGETGVAMATAAARPTPPGKASVARLAAASPKARRLAAERGVDLRALRGSGPGGAVLAADVVTAPAAQRAEAPAVGTVWRIMVERMTASWTTAPHFYLVREVNVSRLVSWLERARKQTGARITYTDLLVKLVAAALAQHPGANASWKDGAIARNAETNIGLAVAVYDGLVVPVLHRADTLRLAELAARPRQGPAGRPADDGPDALLRPPRPRRRPRRPVPRRACGADRGASGTARLTPAAPRDDDAHARVHADRLGAALSRGARGDAGRLRRAGRDRAPHALAGHARREGPRGRPARRRPERRGAGPGRQDLRDQQRRAQVRRAAGQAASRAPGRRLHRRQHPGRRSRDRQGRHALRPLRRPAPARAERPRVRPGRRLLVHRPGQDARARRRPRSRLLREGRRLADPGGDLPAGAPERDRALAGRGHGPRRRADHGALLGLPALGARPDRLRARDVPGR